LPFIIIDMKGNTTKPLKVLSLFTGIGGLDLGFERAKFDIVATLEWDKDCCDTLNLNKEKFLNPTTKIIQADITKIQPEEIYDGDIDFFIGGPPCQTFSAIGRRAGGASGRLDARGDLFKHYCRLLKHYNPRGFMFENVRGILSSNKGQDWKDILAEFESLGYNLKYRVLDTAGYGAAQHRERVILVGYKGEHEFFFPRPTHGPDSIDERPFITPKEALKGVEHTEDVSTLYNLNGKYDHLLADIPPGMNYLFYTPEMGHPEPKFAWRSKFSDFLYKADPALPVKTIVASMGRYSGPFHWDSRKMSIGEFLRLQGFPDGFKLAGGRTSKIKQIGNSVVPVFSYQLALAVKKTVFSEEASEDILLLADNELLSIDGRKSVKAKATRGKRVKPATSQINIFESEKEELRPVPSVRLENATYSFTYKSPAIMEVTKGSSAKRDFVLKLETKKNTLLASLAGKQKANDDLRIEISLKSNALGSLEKLVLVSDWYSSDKPYVIWDAINIAVTSASYYPSIHELYGHFTEPNPKFTIDSFKLPKDGSPMTLLLNWMSDMQNTVGTQPLGILESMGFDTSDEVKLLDELRSKRVDLRTNLTNKRVDEGRFRICYPYTLPIDRKTFVTISR
jgi:DNA (cytosine-5)-methyltransferase 1